MKITELIAKLEQLKTEHGDIEVCYLSGDPVPHCSITQVVPVYPWNWDSWRRDTSRPAWIIALS